MKGVRQTPTGWQAFFRANGRFYSKRFKPDEKPETIKDWLKTARAKADLHLDHREQPSSGSFADDVAQYLIAVKGMRSYEDRAFRLKAWVTALGPDQPRQAITSRWIRQQLEQWRIDGRNDGKGLSFASLNLRRTALMHFWTVTEGKAAINPVRDVPKYRETVPPLRLPTIQQAEKAIEAVRKFSRTRTRLSVLLWTGWPAAQVMRLTKADLRLRDKKAFVQARRKGAGAKGRWLPLLPKAVKALTDFKAAKAFGPFSTSALHSALHRACDKAKVQRFRPYDLRHLFGTIIATSAKDDRVVSELLMHSTLEQARRYTEHSVNPRLTSALGKVARAIR